MKLNVGDYVRTKDGYIGKAMIVTEYCVNIEDKKVVQIGDIVKSSPKIIDLIEDGDYVNNRKIEEIYCCGDYEGLGFNEYEGYTLLDKIKIKTIVTKEQFEQMEYKIGDKNE